MTASTTKPSIWKRELHLPSFRFTTRLKAPRTSTLRLAFMFTFPAMLLGIFGAYILGSFWVAWPDIGHLGAEYNNIAKYFLWTGTYGSPIGGNTGPSAWMTPVLVFILAGLRQLFPVWIVVILVTLLQFVAGWIAIWMLLNEGKRLGELKSAKWIAAGALLANLSQVFARTHNTGLLLLVNCVLWYAIVRLWNGPSTWKQTIAWGAFGGFLALCSPTTGFVWPR